MLNKIKGGLFGLAIGDAMGVATEFMTPAQIKETYGVVTEIIGGGPFQFERGETSDDTAMTVAVAKGIIKNPSDPIDEIGKEFLKWAATGPKDVGITVSASIENYQGDWLKASETTHEQLGQSGGNGTLMRCLPVALAYQDLSKIDELSVVQSKMTHFEDSASDACVIYNRIANRVLNGEELKEAILAEIKNTAYDLDYTVAPDCPPNGYVVFTMRWVLYWLLNKDSFQDVVVGATNMGDDSDTIAAIAGGLKGLEVGFAQLPVQHLERLQGKEELNEIAEKLYDIRKN